MNYKKIKNGMKIAVAAWSNTIVISNAKTNEVIKSVDFSDHIKAVAVARAL